MQDADYRQPKRITAERLVASLLVLVWIGLSWRLFGFATSVRAMLLFMVPLAMIWLPEHLARMALRDSRVGRDDPPPMSPRVLRAVAWSMIVGVPLAWGIFGAGR